MPPNVHKENEKTANKDRKSVRSCEKIPKESRYCCTGFLSEKRLLLISRILPEVRIQIQYRIRNRINICITGIVYDIVTC